MKKKGKKKIDFLPTTMHFHQLSSDVLILVLQYLEEPKDLATLSQVCSYLHNLVRNIRISYLDMIG